MRATIIIAARRNARASDDQRPTYVEVRREEIEAPPDWPEKQLAVAVPLRTIKRAFDSLGGLSGDLDNVEFMVDFEP